MAGIVDFDGLGEAQLVTAERMTAALAHRGPDDEIVEDVGIGVFGFRRLAIVDPLRGRQPVWNERRSVCTMMTGEIFNHHELRRRLAPNHVLFTECDAELLPHLYEEYGTELLDAINGQFAIAIADLESEKVILMRDGIGILPLFYTYREGVLRFGSEIKAILQDNDVPRRASLNGLTQILAYPGAISPNTAFSEIWSLEPGSMLTAARGDVRVSRFWSPRFPPPDERVSDLRHAASTLRNLMEDAVERRLDGGGEAAVYLSGGLDSSLIAALAARSRPVTTVGACFADPSFNEQSAQRIVASAIGARHIERFVTSRELIARLPSVIEHTESPLKETFDVAAMMLSEAVRDLGFKTVLCGQGADELFAGYIGYRFDGGSVSRKRTSNGQSVYERTSEQLAAELDAVLDPDVMRALELERLVEVERVADTAETLSDIDRRTLLDLKLRLADHLLGDHGDRMTFAHGVEGRYPYLDPDVIAFAMSLAGDLKVRDAVEKRVVREAASGLVPEAVIEREKFGFAAPGSPTLLRQGDPLIEETLSRETIEATGIFSFEKVSALRRAYSSPKFRINVPFETDLLMPVITYGLFEKVFSVTGWSIR